MSQFGEWVRQKRQEAHLSQDGLAQLIEPVIGGRYTRDSLAKLEAGSPKKPDANLVMAIARATRQPLTEALGALGYTFEVDRPASSILLPVLESLSPRALDLVSAFARNAEEYIRVALPREVGLRVAEETRPDVTAVIDTEEGKARRSVGFDILKEETNDAHGTEQAPTRGSTFSERHRRRPRLPGGPRGATGDVAGGAGGDQRDER